MAYTTLDLPTQTKKICLKAIADFEKAKKTMGGSKALPGIQAACKAACKKEIDRQMVIYNKEEGEVRRGYHATPRRIQTAGGRR